MFSGPVAGEHEENTAKVSDRCRRDSCDALGFD